MNMTMETLSFENVRKMVGARKPTANKGDNGHALIIAGSELMSGAALMCAAAALRTGTGTIKALVPNGARQAFYNLPECMCIATGEKEWGSAGCELAAPYIEEATALCIGPGMGKGSGVLAMLKLVLAAKKPTVIDADGLNALALVDDKAALLHDKVLLTPHIGEMARLSGLDIDEIKKDQGGAAQAFAQKWGCTVLLKSYQSVIADNCGHAALNVNGNSGLAKGGSGDILSGIALALLAQKLGTFNAGCAAAYILGASADKAMELLKERMLMARDVAEAIEQTTKDLF